jgi:hypothetical protein
MNIHDVKTGIAGPEGVDKGTTSQRAKSEDREKHHASQRVEIKPQRQGKD